jgi:ribosomal protein S18 acetylase RimI-like enzyme
MIEQIGLDRCNEVRLILGDYLNTLDESQRPPPTLIEQVIDHWENQRIEVYAKIDTDNQILGIAILGLVSNRISMICMAEAAQTLDEPQIVSIQIELFEAGYKRLKTTGDFILSGGPLADSIREHALSLGFRGFERASMEASREVLESLDDPTLTQDLSFIPFDESMKGTLGELIYRGNVGSVDVDVFPLFFGTEEHALKLIEDTIDNQFGEFKSPDDSRVLKKGDSLVGVCLISIRGSFAYIPDICIEPSLRRKGLGRALLVHTLKRLMRTYSDLDGVGLDVTLENPAKHLYDSLGFKEQRRYEILNWMKKWSAE